MRRNNPLETSGTALDYADFESLVNRAHAKAETVLGQGEIDPEQFRGIYPDQQIDTDTKTVAEKEQIFKSKEVDPETLIDVKVGKILEAIFYDQVKNNYYLGENTKIEKSSKYDDIEKGVDFITEHDDKGKKLHMALAIDASSKGSVSSKFRTMERAIRDGAFTKIRYFKTGEQSAGLRDVPRVMIGLNSKELLTELMQAWVNGENEKLRDHPVQAYFLAQVYSQLEASRVYHEHVSKRPKIMEIYERLTNIIKPILREKLQKHSIVELAKQDNTYTILRQQLNGLNFKYFQGHPERKPSW